MSPSSLNDSVRQLMADVRTEWAQGADIASSSTTDLSAATGGYVVITGTVTITAFGTASAGIRRKLRFSGALILTHNATSLILPTGGNITTVAGDTCEVMSEGSGNWRVLWYAGKTIQAASIQAASIVLTGTIIGTSAMLSPITNSLGADVLLNNTANYFDGPSIAQGASGTWFVSATVSVSDAGGATYFAKLWDGTTIIASAQGPLNVSASLALSGFITAPAGNLRISVRDPTTVNGKILFNASGNSKDSTITAIRIG
jgi:hypothetical protein